MTVHELIEHLTNLSRDKKGELEVYYIDAMGQYTAVSEIRVEDLGTLEQFGENPIPKTGEACALIGW